MKSTPDSESVFRKKGFFIALYSCLGVVAVLAVVITFANRAQTPQGTEFAYEQEDAVPVGADDVESYLAGIDQEAWFRPRQTDPPTSPPVSPPESPTSPRDRPPAPESLPHPSSDEAIEDPTEPPTEPPQPEAAEPDPAPAPQIVTFEPFTDDDRLQWPLYGETVMPFSVTSLIYDPTLDQFRTNDNLRIAANEGDPVRAGADGRVIAVGRNVRQGNYVTIDHGNGTIVTLGQLMDEKLVGEGEIVRAGQIIGGVGQPSIFGSGNGPHVHLQLKRDNLAVDPYYWLTARSD